MRKKFLGLVFAILLLGVLTYVASATVYPSYNTEADCRGCHGSDVSNRHHMLVVNGLFQCTDCHPMIYDNSTQTYSPELIRNCLVCHPGKNHAQIHHLFASQGLFVCSDCHPVVYDNSTQTYSTQVTWDCTVCHSTVLSIQNTTPTPTPSPTPTPTPSSLPGPTITNFTPISPVNNIIGDSRDFEIMTDQTANVTWYMNETQVQSDAGVMDAIYTNTNASLGIWNVTAIASNINGTVMYNWSWNVTSTPLTIPPKITAYVPITSPVADFAETPRRFGISINNQMANITWYINGSQVQFNENVTQASYTNTSSSPGVWNVGAVAINTNGSVAYSWVWNVIPPIPAIIYFSPISPVIDFVGNLRNFALTTNQTANVTWYINGTQVQFNGSVMDASYNNTNVQPGIWNVSAVASNIYGFDIFTWIWNVTRSPKTPTGSHAAIYCSICHVQQPIEIVCYQCHNNSANSANGTNIYLQFTKSNDTYPGLGTNKGYYNKVNTRHDIADSDHNYSSTKLECIDCHSAHNASRTNVLVDAHNRTSFNQTMIHPGTGQVVTDYVSFCLKCHDNTWSINVTGPSIITNISYVYFTLNTSNKGDWHGAAGGDKYNNSFLIGPYLSQKGKSYVLPMPCNDCHDSHGSGGLYHLKTLTDQYGINITLTSQNINTSDVAHWCSHCHKDPMQKNTSTQTKGNCLTGQCHSHGKRF